jgi:putative ATP-binding cassette transporter
MSTRGRHAWSRFLTITRPFFCSEVRWQATALLALLVVLLLSVSGLNVLNSFVGRDFMTAIAERHSHCFFTLALIYAGVFALSTLVAGGRFTEECLGLRWRAWLTRHLIDRYLAGRTYYRVNARSDIDNPDQRIAEDVKTFTVNALALLLIVLNAAITLCSFAGILWSITPWLFLAAILYAVGGSLMTLLLGRRMVGLDILQLKKEADLRFELIRLRGSAEPVALLGGERHERCRLLDRLNDVVANARRLIGVNRNLGFFTTGYDYLTQLIPALIVAPLYMRGEIEFGTVTQAAMAFCHVLGAASILIKEFPRITTFAAVVKRLGTFWEATADEPPAPGPAVAVVEEPGRLAFDRLTLRTPRDGRLLVKELTLEVPEGERLLILGPNGSGRSALLRATAGLWKRGAGCICRPRLADVMFLPEEPYLVPGSLRDQLVYGTHSRPDDRRILEVLRRLKFEPVLERAGGLDAEGDWPGLLSRGEQQVLSFARLLLANPTYAFLDQATSALDASRAHSLYETLSETAISYMSVGDDRRLMRHHDLLLELHGHGAWAVSRGVQAASASAESGALLPRSSRQAMKAAGQQPNTVVSEGEGTKGGPESCPAARDSPPSNRFGPRPGSN